MKRRDAIALLIGAAWPFSSRAQPSRIPLVGFLSSRSREESAGLARAWNDGLREGGYVEGRTIAVEYRWAEGRLDRLSALAAELAGRQVNVLVAVGGSSSALAAKAATSSIPIVFVIGGDPVGTGLVSSLPRPGGNATGISIISADLAPKRLALLRELVPEGRAFTVLTNPETPEGQTQAADALAAAQQLRLDVRFLSASDEMEIEAAFVLLARQRTDALLVGSDPVFDVHRDKLVAMAARLGCPAIYQFRQFAVAGGLMSYGPDIGDAYRQAGAYAAKILKGAEPASLPVLRPTRFELVINMRTARTLGIAVPLTLQAQADEVID